MPSIEQIEDILAQTQCGECGYDGCTPYAEALLKNEIAINRCRPGGERVVKKLAALLNKPVIRPALPQQALKTAEIQANDCIGCTLCIQSCPTNCIIGAPKQLHSVYIKDCTGCKLCVDICPEKCIDILEHPLFSKISELPLNKKEIWEEERRNEVHILVKNRNKIKQKELKSTRSSKRDPKIAISAEQMDLIAKARAKSKIKYSSK